VNKTVFLSLGNGSEGKNVLGGGGNAYNRSKSVNMYFHRGLMTSTTLYKHILT